MKKKNPKIIAICSSASFYKQVLEIEKELKRLGFKVKTPKTVNIMKKNNNFDVSYYKTWFKNEKDYTKKTKLMVHHFNKILKSDAILVVNYEKNGVDGYIGGNTLMEMLVAFLNKKKIFILNEISGKLTIEEEIYGLKPIFIKGKLERINF